MSAGEALDPTGRFSDRARDYVRHRPGYPAAAVDAALAGIAAPRAATVLDVGAGSGIWTRLVAGRGPRVIALEPNAAMRAAAEPHPRVEWRDGTAEATGLADAAVTAVTAAQAFHWFRPAEALAEFRRVLAPGGWLVLVWNRRDESDPFTRAYGEAVRRAIDDPAIEAMRFDPGVVADRPGFGPLARQLFPHAHEHDEEGLVGRARSASYVPREGPAREALERELRALHARHAATGGRVALRYLTEVWRAARR